MYRIVIRGNTLEELTSRLEERLKEFRGVLRHINTECKAEADRVVVDGQEPVKRGPGRPRKIEGPLLRRWSVQDDAYLKEHFASMSLRQLAKDLRRTKKSVSLRKHKLGLLTRSARMNESVTPGLDNTTYNPGFGNTTATPPEFLPRV